MRLLVETIYLLSDFGKSQEPKHRSGKEESMKRNPLKRSNVLLIAGALASIVSLGTIRAATTGGEENLPTSSQQKQTEPDGEVHVLPVQGNVYMLVGAGGNITAQVGGDGVLLVDAGRAGMSEKVLAAVRTISSKPIRYIVDTSIDSNHAGGNEGLGQAGASINGGTYLADTPFGANNLHQGASIIGFQTIFDRMTAKNTEDSAPENAWPMDSYSDDHKSLHFNGEAIQIYHQPAAHTDGDSMVLFRRSDVVSTGEIFTTTSYPVIDLKRGGSIQGIIDGLNRLVYDITVMADKEEGGTMVIPGRGRLCDQYDVVVYQEMVIIIRDRIQYMVKQGKTLEQVKQAAPTRDFDPRYGSTSGPWTTEMFVEAVYKSLTSQKEEPAK
jgi:cyclase